MPDRTYGDVGSGGGYAPPLPPPPRPPTPDQLVPPLAAGAVQPYVPGQATIPPVGAGGVQSGLNPVVGTQPPQQDLFSQLFGWLGGTGMLGNQLAAQQAQPAQDQGGPPFPWQRPAWQREGYNSEQAYNADLNRGY